MKDTSFLGFGYVGKEPLCHDLMAVPGRSGPKQNAGAGVVLEFMQTTPGWHTVAQVKEATGQSDATVWSALARFTTRGYLVREFPPGQRKGQMLQRYQAVRFMKAAQ